MSRYKIVTPYGGWYETDEKGRVMRCDNGLDKRNASDHDKETWKILGATSTHAFSSMRIIPLADLIGSELRYKNRNPKYTLVDWDHGTIRVHGNSKVHGIASITEIP